MSWISPYDRSLAPTHTATPIHCWQPCPRLGTGSALREMAGEAGTQEKERDKVCKLLDKKLASYELIEGFIN